MRKKVWIWLTSRNEKNSRASVWARRLEWDLSGTRYCSSWKIIPMEKWTTVCMYYLNTSKSTLNLTSTRLTLVKMRAAKSKSKLMKPSGIRPDIDRNRNIGIHRLYFRSKVSSIKETFCRHCFHRQTGCFIFDKFRNCLWAMMSQLEMDYNAIKWNTFFIITLIFAHYMRVNTRMKTSSNREFSQ